MAELHRLQDPVHDHRRAEAGAEPEEQHPPALVAAERLHRRVVHDLGRLPERGLEVEADPARPRLTGSWTTRPPETIAGTPTEMPTGAPVADQP